MKAGDRALSPIFGEIVIRQVFDSEEEARKAGYYYDAHVFILGFKVLADDRRGFCAVRVPV